MNKIYIFIKFLLISINYYFIYYILFIYRFYYYIYYRIMQMALIHDLAECIVGDITPSCGIPSEIKHKLEDEAMEDICKLLGDRGPMILEIFRV